MKMRRLAHDAGNICEERPAARNLRRATDENLSVVDEATCPFSRGLVTSSTTPTGLPSSAARLNAAPLILFILLNVAAVSWADERTDFFETRIRPQLVKHCYECHSTASSTAEGGLNLD